MTQPHSLTSAFWQPVKFLFLALVLVVLSWPSLPTSWQRTLTQLIQVRSEESLDDRVRNYFDSRGQTIPDDVAGQIISDAINQALDEGQDTEAAYNYAITGVNQYLSVLSNLRSRYSGASDYALNVIAMEHRQDTNQARIAMEKYNNVLNALRGDSNYNSISDLALSIVAVDSRDDVNQAKANAASVATTAQQLQDNKGISLAAAQIIATQLNTSNIDTFSDALAIANSVLNDKNNNGSVAGASGLTGTGGEILSALDKTGILNMTNINSGNIASRMNSMMSSSSLSSNEAKGILAATNIFTTGNFGSDANKVLNAVSRITSADAINPLHLPADVAGVVGNKELQSLAAQILGTSSKNLDLGSLASSTLGKAKDFKEVYDNVKGGLSAEQISKLGENKIKEMVAEKMSLPKEQAKSEAKSTAQKAAETTPGSTSTPPTSTPPGSSTPAPGSPTPTSSPTPSGTPSPSSSPSPHTEKYVKTPTQGIIIEAILKKAQQYVDENSIANEAINGYLANQIAKNMAMEGYEVYHIKSVNHIYPYLNYLHRKNNVDFSKATIPLLRNADKKYAYERLNSAENYYGYGARPDVNTDDDLLTESAWIAKMTQPVKCTLKLSNLAYIVRTCDLLKDSGCQALYYTADGSETIRGTRINLHDLALIMTVLMIKDGEINDNMWNGLAAALVASGGSLGDKVTDFRNQLNTMFGGDSADILDILAKIAANKIFKPAVDNRMKICESLYDTEAYDTQALEKLLSKLHDGKIGIDKDIINQTDLGNISQADLGKIYIRLAIEKLDFYLARQYRSAYLVQTTRICPVKRQWLCDRTQIYKYSLVRAGACIPVPCVDGITPDQVRIYPFQAPELFTNKNFCNTAKETYPGLNPFSVECEPSEDFHYVDMLQEYYDPGLSEKNFFLQTSQQSAKRKELIAKRKKIGENAANACTVNSITTLKESMQDPAKLMCTKFHAYSGDLIDCENCDGDKIKMAIVKYVNGAIDNNTLYDIDNPNGNSKGTDNIKGLTSKEITSPAENKREAAITQINEFNDFCLCRLKAFVFIPYFAYASIDYYVVEPFSDESQIIEETIMTPYFRNSDYQQFLKDDKRQNRKISMQGAKSKLSDIPIWLPAGGPIGNVLIQQEALYTKDTTLYKKFRKCKSVPSYFESRCADDESGSDDKEFDDNKTQCIANATASCIRGCHDDGSSIKETENGDITKIECECNCTGETLINCFRYSRECKPGGL